MIAARTVLVASTPDTINVYLRFVTARGAMSAGALPGTPPTITFLPIFGNSGFISEHFASLDAIILTSSTQPLPRNHRAEAVWSQRSAVAINNQLSQGKRWLAGRPAVSMSEQSDDDTRGWACAASHDNTHTDDNIAGLTTA